MILLSYESREYWVQNGCKVCSLDWVFTISSHFRIKASTEEQRRTVCASWSGHTSDDCIGGCDSRDDSFNHTWKISATKPIDQKWNLGAEYLWCTWCAHKLFKDITELNPLPPHAVTLCESVSDSSDVELSCSLQRLLEHPLNVFRIITIQSYAICTELGDAFISVYLSISECFFHYVCCLIHYPGHWMDIFKDDSLYCYINKYITVKLL